MSFWFPVSRFVIELIYTKTYCKLTEFSQRVVRTIERERTNVDEFDINVLLIWWTVTEMKSCGAIFTYLLWSVKLVSDVSVRWLGQWYWWVAARVWIALSADNSTHVTLLLVVLQMYLTLWHHSLQCFCTAHASCFAVPCQPASSHMEQQASFCFCSICSYCVHESV